MKVSELRSLCERIENEVGPEVEVYLQLRDDLGRLIEQDYCDYSFTKQYKKLVLSNRGPIKI